MFKFTKNLISISLVFILVVAITIFASTTSQVKAGSLDNLSGWAWSDNIGWISFNSTTDGSLVNYGVAINETNKTTNGTGDFSGYAWSDNIGWISFNRVDTGNPPGAPFNTG